MKIKRMHPASFLDLRHVFLSHELSLAGTIYASQGIVFQKLQNNLLLYDDVVSY